MNNVELSITDLTPDGYGVGQWMRPDGLLRPVVVPNSLPGETVTVDIVRCKSKKVSGFLGKLVAVVKPSTLRITARCKHFSICGGCTWQQLPYHEQLRLKEAEVKRLFAEYEIASSSFYPIIGCASPWQYRNKMEFTFSEDTKGQKFLGLIMRCSKGRVFNVEECHLMNPWVEKTVQACRNWWVESALSAFYMPKNSGSLRYLTLRESQSTGDRVVILQVSGNPDYAVKRHLLDRFVSMCQEVATPKDGAKLTCVLRIEQLLKGRQTEYFEMVLHGPHYFRERVTIDDHLLEFHVSPSSFFQPNSLQASLLYQTAITLAELSAEMVLYDLYAGIGVFGMCAARRVKEVVAMELSADSAYDARVNSERLALHNFRIIRGDVAKILQDPNLPKADAVIVDPPRSGLGKKACLQILNIQPQTIVYVSCNPKTQAQDLKEFVSRGYIVKAIQPIDQFPQTIHVENIVILKKSI